MNEVLPVSRKELSSNAPTMISKKVTDVLTEGQMVKVLVLDVDNRGRIKLSIKDVEAAEASGV